MCIRDSILICANIYVTLYICYRWSYLFLTWFWSLCAAVLRRVIGFVSGSNTVGTSSKAPRALFRYLEYCAYRGWTWRVTVERLYKHGSKYSLRKWRVRAWNDEYATFQGWWSIRMMWVSAVLTCYLSISSHLGWMIVISQWTAEQIRVNICDCINGTSPELRHLREGHGFCRVYFGWGGSGY